MPAYPRRHILGREAELAIHCWTRCVRRAFLCGKDRYSGRDYEHRRLWIMDTEQQLAELFAIEIEFRAEMQNHLHVVLRTRPDIAKRWPREKVVRNWLKITRIKRGSNIDAWEPPEALIKQHLRDPDWVKQRRRRLSNVSWFMGALCERIARLGNEEDRCKGRFFQGRFECRVLENEQAILQCGIYVDLNVIRAGEAQTPETSRHTSIYDRLQACQARAEARRMSCDVALGDQPDHWMSPLELDEGQPIDSPLLYESFTGRRASDKGVLSMSLAAYVQLLEWTGRQLRDDKRGAIPADVAPIFERLGLDSDDWLSNQLSLEAKYHAPIPTVDQLRVPPPD